MISVSIFDKTVYACIKVFVGQVPEHLRHEGRVGAGGGGGLAAHDRVVAVLAQSFTNSWITCAAVIKVQNEIAFFLN